jgi:hypothetical protein
MAPAVVIRRPESGCRVLIPRRSTRAFERLARMAPACLWLPLWEREVRRVNRFPVRSLRPRTDLGPLSVQRIVVSHVGRCAVRQ